ncbi:MAG: cell division protein FtsQ/DivIB [Alphaproteobacteria bacterium]
MRRLNQIFDLGNSDKSGPGADKDNSTTSSAGLGKIEPEFGTYAGSSDGFDAGTSREAGSENPQSTQESGLPWRRNSDAESRAKALNFQRWRQRIGVGFAATTALVVVIGGFWALTTGRLDVARFQIRNSAEASLGGLGLTLQEFVLEGERRYTTKIQIRESLNTSRGDPILAVEPQILRQRLMTLPWIKEVMVERVLPNKIVVTLEEHQPLAVWQFKGKQALLDESGNTIDVKDLAPFSNLPVLVGSDADKFGPEFLGMMQKVSRLSNKLEVAQLVNGRRWTLKLDNGVLIHLPEENALDALNRVAILDKTDSLLSRDVLEIDLRLADRMVVRTNSGADPEQILNSTSPDLGERT